MDDSIDPAPIEPATVVAGFSAFRAPTALAHRPME
jgi:hypothetical protein